MIKSLNQIDEQERGIYFHEMAEDSRSLELLLHTCYNNKIIPTLASKGHGKNKVAYIILEVDHSHLNTIGRLIDLTIEIPESEFNIRSRSGKIYAEISCDTKDGDQLFTRIKEIVEEQTIENHTHNLTLMNTIYNIAKIINNIIQADMLFATNETLYNQGKCGVSIYKDKQFHKLNTKKADDIIAVIKTLKEKATLNLPVLFFCSFEELRTFYFELDETVYGQNEGDL